MGFQIKDKEGNAIRINTLDEQAANFWGQQVDTKKYAVPTPEEACKTRQDFIRQTNWFDMIGHMIHSPQTTQAYYDGWKEVKKNLILLYMESAFLSKETNQVNDSDWVGGYFNHIVTEHLKPYLELIDYWDSLGYTPHQVID